MERDGGNRGRKIETEEGEAGRVKYVFFFFFLAD